VPDRVNVQRQRHLWALSERLRDREFYPIQERR
jgi:hypothetical protein